MLVLSRREKERIVFPDLGVTVEVVSIVGNRARLGVQAPREIRVLRHEIAENEVHGSQPVGDRRSLSHEFRNVLQEVTFAARLAREQLRAGEAETAAETIDGLLARLAGLSRELAAQREPSRPQPAAPRLRKALLVDDNQNERRLLESYLRLKGYDVAVAGDGADALDYLRTHDRPDFVLLDMLMPRVDGPNALGRIRRDPELRDLKVFAVSGTQPEQLGVATGPGGVDCWFQKPVDPEELVQVMERTLTA
ncbi:MAG: response regulator [Planctomycetes bacterium]|nr:response regulator [Planctomycetota bacterium]